MSDFTDKEFTAKEVFILVFGIVVAIAFLETPASSAIWTPDFFKPFLLKVFVYGAVAEFVVILLATFNKK